MNKIYENKLTNSQTIGNSPNELKWHSKKSAKKEQNLIANRNQTSKRHRVKNFLIIDMNLASTALLWSS